MPQTLLKFIGQTLKSPASIGAIWPSSRMLAETILAPIDFSTACSIVEIGPGTGAITDVLAKKLRPQSRYLGIELNTEFHKHLIAHFPALTFVNRNAEDMAAILRESDLPAADAVVCSLPWTIFDPTQQERFVTTIRDNLAPGGLLITFAYLHSLAMPSAWELRRLLTRHFTKVTTTKPVWDNVPPAFVYVCRR